MAVWGWDDIQGNDPIRGGPGREHDVVENTRAPGEWLWRQVAGVILCGLCLVAVACLLCISSTNPAGTGRAHRVPQP